ncbi:MAG: RsmF rRNA methyltransferase first C-terminal domain-containing protein [Eubacteriales bacterium]|nr:RsmF rRNA methyltransferase first C-terminal domain-containing protein [Eubacteriales bacterium]
MRYPEKWLENMKEQFPQEYEPLLRALEEPSFAGMRINPLRAKAGAEAVARYAGRPVAWYPQWGRYVRQGRPGADLAHFAGAYYMQDPSAMSAVAALAPAPGERILDLCAAPGGKSGQIAAEVGLGGVLVANEVDKERARMLAGNLERLGIANAAVVSAMPDVLAQKWPGLFDAVLCDAPCSGEGMFRRDPAAREEWDERSPEGCAARQRPILEAAAALLRPGGRLVYSTCTFNVHENEENVRWLLQMHPELQPAQFSLPGVGESAEGCLRLWPHRIDGEGHFVAVLRKAEAPERAPRKERAKGGKKQSAEAAAARQALEALLRENICDFGLFNGWRPELIEDRLMLVPQEMPDTSGIYCLRRGLPCCKVGRSHVSPEHSLAMALQAEECACELDLNEEQTEVWLRGETVSAEPNGKGKWVWMHCKGLPLGWGKHSDGQIKNHLPKGLWRR